MSTTGAMRRAVSELEKERAKLDNMLQALYRTMPRRRRSKNPKKKRR